MTEDPIGYPVAMLTDALDGAGALAFEWDLVTDRIVWVGDAEAVLGCECDGLDTGYGYRGRIHPEDLPTRQERFVAGLKGQTVKPSRYRLRLSSGRFTWVEERGGFLRRDCERPTTYRGLLRAVEAEHRIDALIEYRARFDDTTGHLNRSVLLDALHQSLAFATRYSVPGAFLAVGIIGFDGLVSAHGGHVAADVMLQAGFRLERVLRTPDLIGRLRDDGFGVILSQIDVADLSVVADKLKREIESAPIPTPVGPLTVRVAVGAVDFPVQVQSPFEAFFRAERCLDEALNGSGGRKAVVLSRATVAERSERTRLAQVAEDVSESLRSDRLALAFQPVVEADGGGIRFYETLLRLFGANGEVIPAGAFIPAVERLGMNRIVDRRVLEMTVAELDAHRDIRLSMNISGFTAADHSWLRTLRALVAHRPNIAERLILEVTETASILDLSETARFLTKVRDFGCHVALDDYGAGHTSLQQLISLPIDTVKIDGAFCSAVDSDPEARRFVRKLLDVAKRLRLTTVGEKVETETQAAVLAGEGVDLLQGWYFAKPSLERPWLAGPSGVPQTIGRAPTWAPMRAAARG